MNIRQTGAELRQNHRFGIGQQRTPSIRSQPFGPGIAEIGGQDRHSVQRRQGPPLQGRVVPDKLIDQANHLAHRIGPLGRSGAVQWRLQLCQYTLDPDFGALPLAQRRLQRRLQHAGLAGFETVQRRFALQPHAHDMQTLPVAGKCVVQRGGKSKAQGVDIDQRLARDGQGVPAHDIQRDELGLRDLPVLDGNNFATFRADFVGVPPLQITGKYDTGRQFPHNLPGMDMSKRQIVISGGDQSIEPRGGVRTVVGASGQTGVEDANIETASHGCRISWHQIFCDRAVRKAAPMDRHAQIAHYMGLCDTGAEDVDVGLSRQLP